MRCSCGSVFKHREPCPGPEGSGSRAEPNIAEEKDGDPRRLVDSGVLESETLEASPYNREYFTRYDRRHRRRVTKARRQILDALEVAPDGRLLDVGCSLGYSLEAAAQLGLNADGVDVSKHAVEECLRRGLTAWVGTLDQLPFEDASFAVAVLKHVFEHTPTPRLALRELHRVLVPGAAVFFAVPNVDYFKAIRSPRTARFYCGHAAREHFLYYSPATLGRLLEEEGFRVAGVHPCLIHRRAGLFRRLVETVLSPIRIPLRFAAAALGLRKEFWLVAVRS